MKPTFTILLTVACLASAWLPAQGTAEVSASKLAQVRDLHAKVTAQRDTMSEASRKLRGLERNSDEFKAAAAELSKIRENMQPAQEAFDAAFAACEWTGFDTTKDADLLKQGLSKLAYESHDAKRAVAASRFFLQHFGEDRSAQTIRSRALPMALLGTGDAAGALKELQAAADAAEGPAKASMLLTVGDVIAAGGDIEGARAKYDAAAELADERTMSYVTLRRELIGKTAPEIASDTWVGGEATPLSKLAGKVVLVDFWATWCGPCRAVMPGLNSLYRANKDKGLLVLGVARYDGNAGYMPANPEQMRSGGKQVPKYPESEFVAHITEFKQNTDIAYPFVVGSKAISDSYFVKGIPTLAVVDRQGKIALITVGSGSEGLLTYAVERLLGAK